MHYVIYSISVDDIPWERLDPASLPQQSLMELVVEGVASKDIFYDEEGNFKDIEKWKGIVMSASGRVKRIRWCNFMQDFFPGGGSINLRWLPASVTYCNVFGDKLQGHFDVIFLPDALTELFAAGNRLTGTVDLCRLPATIVIFSVSSNELHGTLDFTQLPEMIQRMFLAKNKFSGTIDLTHLPEKLEQITIDTNQLEGYVRARLPATVIRVNATKNLISGVIDEAGKITAEPRIVYST